MITRLLAILTAIGAFTAASAIVAADHAPSYASTAARGATTTEDSLQQTLESAERRSWVAWQKRDGAYFQHFLSDDHVEVGTNGLSSKADVVAFVGSPVCVVKSYTVDHFRITRFDANTALLTYRAEQNTMCGKTQAPSPAWVSSLFVRRNGLWENALYQQTKAE
jgi:hypothetical protein